MKNSFKVFGPSTGRMASSFIEMKMKVKSLSRVRLFATPWTGAHQAPQSMEFSRQKYWSGLPFPSPVIEMRRGVLEADSSSRLGQPAARDAGEGICCRPFL